MIKTFASMSVILALGLTPALAGKDRHKGESVLDRLEGLQERLQQEDLSDRQRDKFEGQLERIIEKYGIELPPEPEPEPTKLFSDNFERPEGQVVGNGWEGGGVITDGKLSITSGDSQTNRASHHTDLDGEYTDLRIAYDMWIDPVRSDGKTIVSISLDGADYITYGGGIIPGTASAFDLRFETEGFRHITVDNLTVTGTPVPASEPFVGF
jgi:hypothetical protein